MSTEQKEVAKLTPGQIQVIKDLNKLNKMENEFNRIYDKYIRGTPLACNGGLKEYEYYQNAILAWILENGYTPQVK